MDKPSKATIAFWVVIIILSILLIWEICYKNNCYYGSRNCGPKWSWAPEPGDDVTTLVERIKNGTEANRLIHSRPLALISSIIIALGICFYFYKKVPKITDFLVVLGFQFGLIWTSYRFFEMHRLYDISNRTQDSVTELKYQLGVDTRPSL